MQDTQKLTGRGGAGRGQGRKTNRPTTQINPRVYSDVVEWLDEIAGEGYRGQAVNIILSYAKDIDKGVETISLVDRLEMIKALR